MDIGPFQTASSEIIPAGTARVHTSSYYSDGGTGGDACYIYNSSIEGWKAINESDMT